MLSSVLKTYVIGDVGVGVFLQQQRHQAMALPLTGVVQSCVPLLERRTANWYRHRFYSSEQRDAAKGWAPRSTTRSHLGTLTAAERVEILQKGS